MFKRAIYKYFVTRNECTPYLLNSAQELNVERFDEGNHLRALLWQMQCTIDRCAVLLLHLHWKERREMRIIIVKPAHSKNQP